MRWFVPFLILFFAGCPKGGDLPSPVPAPGYVPSAEMQQLVAEITPVSEPALAAFYGDFADVIERDFNIITTTEQFRLLNTRAGQLAFQKTGMQGKHPGLAPMLEAVTTKVLGIQNGPLDRPKAVELLKALQWALQ